MADEYSFDLPRECLGKFSWMVLTELDGEITIEPVYSSEFLEWMDDQLDLDIIDELEFAPMAILCTAEPKETGLALGLKVRITFYNLSDAVAFKLRWL